MSGRVKACGAVEHPRAVGNKQFVILAAGNDGHM